MNVVTSSRKHLAILMALVMFFSMIPMMAMADGHEMTGVAFRIDVMGYWIDGEWMEADVAPYIQDNRTMVPVAHAARAIDATVQWNAANQMVTVTKGATVVTMTIGNNVMMIGEEVVVMDTVPVIKDLGGGLGRTMLPVAWLAKALDVPYTWNAGTRTATFMPVAKEVVAPVIFDEAGTFGPATGTVTIDNDVIITAKDVILQNYVITGDLIIAEEVGEGNVTLNNITVGGELIVRGGGEDSIYINGGNIKTVRIEAISSGAVRIVAIDAEGMEIIVSEQAAGKKIILEGNFDTVTIEATDVIIETRGVTAIREMVVTATAANVTVTLSAATTVERAVVDSKTVSFEGAGTVKATAGTEKDSITFGANVKQPVAPAPAPGPVGGGGGGAQAPTLQDNVLAAVRSVASQTLSVTRSGNTITATIQGNASGVLLTQAYSITGIFSAIDAQGLRVTNVHIGGSNINIVDGTNVLGAASAIQAAVVRLAGLNVEASYSQVTLGHLAGKNIQVTINGVVFTFAIAAQ